MTHPIGPSASKGRVPLFDAIMAEALSSFYSKDALSEYYLENDTIFKSINCV